MFLVSAILHHISLLRLLPKSYFKISTFQPNFLCSSSFKTLKNNIKSFQFCYSEIVNKMNTKIFWFHSQDTQDIYPPNQQGTRPYITARFNPRKLPGQFVLGTGLHEMFFFNRPLDPDRKYRVFLRAYTVKKVQMASKCYHRINIFVHRISVISEF